MGNSHVELSTPVAGELLKAARDGYITLTRAGQPVAYVLPTSLYDEVDIEYMKEPSCWKAIRGRRQSAEPTVSLEEVLKELRVTEPVKSHAARKNGVRRKKSHAPA